MGSQEGVNCIHLFKVNWKGFTRIVMFTSQDLKNIQMCVLKIQVVAKITESNTVQQEVSEIVSWYISIH